MPASVNRDIPADGAMLTCVSCHLRSGMGSIEGGIAARPVSGPRLYESLFRSPKELRRRKPRSPRSSAEPDLVRPAYTDETLARAIREGIDASGRTLDAAMPRYVLDDQDMAILVGYLKYLSTERSLGVTDTTLRFATVVTDGVPPADRDAMLATLEAYVADRNAQPRRPQLQTPAGATYLEPMYAGYSGPRRLELVRWELGGAPETWRRQLDALYRARPVFGLVGGMAVGEWRPMHEFSEDAGVPSLFPITDLPVVSGTDWQTLYLSKGLYQEGETAARYLLSRSGLPAGTPVVEVLRDTPEGRALSKGFEETWRTLGRPEPVRKTLGPEERLTVAALQTAASAGESGVAVLWLGRADMSTLVGLISAPRRPRMLLVSSGLLGGALDSIPEPARSLTYITYPGPLPEEQERRMAAVESWLRARSIPLSRPAVQSRAYFIGWMLTAALARMRDDFYRDYLLDTMDMMSDQTYAIVAHERVSFGPSQRYASKGCYVVQLGPGLRPELRKRSEWVVH
jgi:substrate-binding family protein